MKINCALFHRHEKNVFLRSLVIIHPIDVYFTKFSSVISITLNNDKDSMTATSKVTKEDKSSLKGENGLQNSMLTLIISGVG